MTRRIRRESNPAAALVYALLAFMICVGSCLLMCVAPRLVEWR